MHALRTVRHVEAILDAQAGMLALHLPRKFVRADVETTPTLCVTDEAGDGQRALHHARQLLAFLHIVPVASVGSANRFLLVQPVELGELLISELLDAAARIGVLRAALASFITIGAEHPRVALRYLVAL